MSESSVLAVVTGASTGIGFELARQSAKNGFDLLIAADEAEIHDAAHRLEGEGAVVQALEVNLATTEGVDKLLSAVGSRPIDALLANAGRGLGHAFVDQNFDDVRYVIYLIHK